MVSDSIFIRLWMFIFLGLPGPSGIIFGHSHLNSPELALLRNTANLTNQRIHRNPPEFEQKAQNRYKSIRKHKKHEIYDTKGFLCNLVLLAPRKDLVQSLPQEPKRGRSMSESIGVRAERAQENQPCNFGLNGPS